MPLAIPHLRNYLTKRKRELSEEFKALQTDTEKIENLARQTEIERVVEWVDKQDERNGR